MQCLFNMLSTSPQSSVATRMLILVLGYNCNSYIKSYRYGYVIAIPYA